MEQQAIQQDRRRQTRREIDLNRDDLFFLLESYRNMIELNTTLLERQEVLNRGIERILSEANKICFNQNGITNNIDRLPEEVKILIESFFDQALNKMASLEKEMKDNRFAENNEHHAHNLKIYVNYGILSTIILALIGIIAKIWPGP